MSLQSLTHIQSSVFVPGPLLPQKLAPQNSMVNLGNGLAIIGDQRCYRMKCSNRACSISFLDRTLSVPRDSFVAIPIPDETSGCISKSKNHC